MRGWQSARSKARAPDAAWSDAALMAPSWPPKAPDEAALAVPPELPVAVLAEPAAEPAMIATLALQPQVLHLLEVVTTMCDHVIEYIEADRAERRLMLETLTQLGQVVTDRARAAAEAPSPPLDAPVDAPVESPTESFEARERVIGGSMPAGPEPVIDLRQPEPESGPETQTQASDPSVTTTEIAVEVRGRFGDRWVGGFEICEVMTTPDGPRYRLRRHRDGVVLPELFDATSIRHIETFDQLNDDQLNDSTGYWSRS